MFRGGVAANYRGRRKILIPAGTALVAIVFRPELLFVVIKTVSMTEKWFGFE